MHSYHLDALLSGHVFGFLLLLMRVGAIMMLFPGIGESYVPPRTRMGLALVICLILLEPMLPRLPSLPSGPAEMTQLLVYETIIGIFFGTLIRLLLSALETTGMIIGMQTGLSNATMLNPALATQSPLPAAFLSTAALVLIFVSGMDYFLIRSIVALYDLFPVGGPFMPGDMAQTMINVTNRSFVVGVELAAPFLIMGLLLYTGLGILQRLMPQIQIFMLSMPVQIWGGLTVFGLSFASILGLWMRYFDQSVGSFFER